MLLVTPSTSDIVGTSAQSFTPSQGEKISRESENYNDPSLLHLLGDLHERLRTARIHLTIAATFRRRTHEDDKAHEAISRAEIELMAADSAFALLQQRLLTGPENQVSEISSADNVTHLTLRDRLHRQSTPHAAMIELQTRYYIRRALRENGSLVKIEGDVCADDATAIARALRMDVLPGTSTIEVWRDRHRLFSGPVRDKQKHNHKRWRFPHLRIPWRLPPQTV